MSEPSIKPSRLSASNWQGLMSEYESSDLSQRVFCAQRGLAHSAFGYWRKRLRDLKQADGAASPLMELTPISPLSLTPPSSLPMPTSPSSPAPLPMIDPTVWRVELDLGQGVILRLR